MVHEWKELFTISNKETIIQNKIRVALSDYGIFFRANVGKVRMADGRYFDTGLPKGFSDLFGFRFADNKICFVEIKTEIGKVRPDQVTFLKAMKAKGAVVGIARNVEDAIELVTTGSNKSTDVIL